MGDLETLAKARRELQDLYLGVPDDSVNLSFKELAEITQRKASAFSSQLSMHKKSPPPPSETSDDKPPSLAKLPSLDFSRALEAASSTHNNPTSNITHHFDHPHHHHLHYGHASHHGSPYGHHHAINGHAHHHHHASPYGHHVSVDRSMGYLDNDDMTTMAAATPNQARRRRPGIPHSNICTLCTTYIYIFRYRCLVCGRVYCRQCVGIGMGDMAEGRKCVECLGRRFSQRYIHKAGEMGWCMGYPNAVRQQELKWAEKGPNRSRDNRPSQSGMLSTSIRTPPPRLHTPNTPSFVMNSPHSPYSGPTHHHALPF
ncbi:PREDICTED: uncharacterized protein LOC109173941 [Ipomoea nil]|uniref:uncharacterized protein LOC109173941 n=1 Tax=Ipomoea nil TaxID=35883 RepID=UPI000900B500|nr:PREDICTED: uncharacterized protein LOC109173941 [Ipomoea nil]